MNGYEGICALTDSSFSESSDGKHKWAVRINAHNKWINIGICQTRLAQEHQFEEWDLMNIGHGHYCVVSNGFVLSHSDASVNC